MVDTSSILKLPGSLRLGSVILGIAAVALHANNYNDRVVWLADKGIMQRLYLAILIIALILSLAWVIVRFFSLVANSKPWRIYEVIYHVVMGLLLLLSLGLMVYDLVEIGKFAGNYGFCSPPTGCIKLRSTEMYRKWAAEASFGVIFGGINTALYFFIALIVWKSE